MAEEDDDLLDMNGEQEEQTKSRNPLVLCLIAAGVIVVVMVGALVIKNLSFAPKEENKPVATASSTSSAATSDGGTSTSDGTAAPSDGGKSTNPVTPKATEGTGKPELEYNKVKDPKLQGKYEAGAFVMDKYIYEGDGQLQYVLEIQLTNKGGNSKTVRYFTTKDIYDTMKVGSLLKVKYSGDPNGNIAITSVTR